MTIEILNKIEKKEENRKILIYLNQDKYRKFIENVKKHRKTDGMIIAKTQKN